MNPARLLILVSAASFALVGITYLIVPASALAIVGIPSSPTSDFLLRTEGVALLTGAGLLLAVRDGSRTQLRVALVSLAGYFVVGSIVDFAAFAQGIVGPASVPSAAVRIALGLACAVTALRIGPPSPSV
jgi:hypothetical protein